MYLPTYWPCPSFCSSYLVLLAEHCTATFHIIFQSLLHFPLSGSLQQSLKHFWCLLVDLSWHIIYINLICFACSSLISSLFPILSLFLLISLIGISAMSFLVLLFPVLASPCLLICFFFYLRVRLNALSSWACSSEPQLCSYPHNFTLRISCLCSSFLPIVINRF